MERTGTTKASGRRSRGTIRLRMTTTGGWCERRLAQRCRDCRGASAGRADRDDSDAERRRRLYGAGVRPAERLPALGRLRPAVEWALPEFENVQGVCSRPAN